jgi:adenosylmethionine-8-amino-7-oxononanoate aminotransferase
MCLAKGITSGYIPMGATLCRAEIFEAFLGKGREFRHGNTYSGHATAAAAAIANLGILQREKLPENSRKVGAYMLRGLRDLEHHPHVGAWATADCGSSNFAPD